MTQPYQLTSGSCILRVSDGANIPADPMNADYQMYQIWLGAGNTPDPASAPVVETPATSPLKALSDLLVSKGLVSDADISAAESEAGVLFQEVSR